MLKAAIWTVLFYLILPPYTHPVRYALRRAGIEKTPTDRFARF